MGTVWLLRTLEEKLANYVCGSCLSDVRNEFYIWDARMQCIFLFLLPSCHAATKCLLPLASAGREGYTGLMYGMFLPSFSHGYEPQTVPAHRTTALLSCHTRFHVEDGRVSAKCQSQSRDSTDFFLCYCMTLM